MAVSEHRKIQQELKQPDPFFEAVLDSRDYFEKNRAQVLGIVGGVAALLVVGIGGFSYYSSQGERAASDFASAVSNLQLDSPSAAEANLQDISGRANSGPYKALASLYSGNIATKAGRFEEAVVAYDQFLANPPTDYLRQIGLMGKAAALEKAGKAPESAAALDLAAAIDGPYRKAALSDRARLAEKAGDKAAAIANLQKLLEMEGSTGDADIERRIAALK